MKHSKIVFIHGNNGGRGAGGSAEEYWFPSVSQALARMGHTVIAKNFPDPKVARRNLWLPFLQNDCGADEHTVLIGHSSGAIAAMRYAETHTLLGSVLVGAYHTDTGDENERRSGYFDAPWDWDAIRKNQKWIMQFASTDDPFFSIEEPRLISRKLHSNYYEYSDKGHFFGEAFPELIEAVSKKLARS